MFLKTVTTLIVPLVAGCSGVPSEGQADNNPQTTQNTTNCDSDGQSMNKETYQYDRGGHLRAEPTNKTTSEWEAIQYSECLHDEIKTAIKKVDETGERQQYALDPKTKADVKENLHNEFGIQSDRFYVHYESSPIQITVIHDD